MIVVPYHITLSPIAGKGLFVDINVPKGRVIAAPTDISPDAVFRRGHIDSLDPNSPEALASARWFEDWHTISTDWPDECYINHSRTPTGLWLLGFVFAQVDLSPGDEVTVDYAYVIGDGEVTTFTDSRTGLPVTGAKWKDNLIHGARMLQELFNA